MSGHRHTLLGRHLWSATPVIISVSLLTYFIHAAGWLDRAETLGLDFFTHLRQPVSPKHVLVVEINDDDYRTLFASRSPLDSAVLTRLIARIASFHPRVIGVDLDTSASSWNNLPPDWAGATSIVWGQAAVPATENGTTILKPLPVLGGVKPTPYPDQVGLGAMPLESDGRIHRYARMLPIEHRETYSLPWSVVRRFCLAVFEEEPKDTDGVALVKRCEDLLDSEGSEAFREHQVLPFAKPPMRLSASAFTDPATPGSDERLHAMIQGKAVLLGGSYSRQDTHFTADGIVPGVELLAEAVDSEFQAKLVTPVEEKLMILAEVLGGYLLAVWHFYSASRVPRWLSRLVVPILAFLLSLVAFWSLDYWANFIPVLVGVSIHELWGGRMHGRQHTRKGPTHEHPQAAQV